MNILWEGARGESVVQLQRQLTELGLSVGPIDGIFGALTTRAVIAFQERHGLHPDGVADRRTLNALKLPVPEVPPLRGNVFVSYSHGDSGWLEKLRAYVAPLERRKVFTLWADTQIQPGKRWQAEIREAIEAAKAAILLVSKKFMESDYIAGIELPRILSAERKRGITILPVMISPCDIGRLSEFQFVNSPSDPLVEMESSDLRRVWEKVVETITDVLNE
jgi:hypothetical protein